MLGLGLSLTTGGVATPAYVVLAKAFVSRVEADGGTVDSFACLKTDMAYLTSNPDAPAGYTAEWSGATVGSSAEFRINLVGGAGYTYTYAVTDTQATEVTGTGVMGGDIQAVTADLSTLVDGTVTLAVYLTGAGGDGNVVTDTANLVGYTGLLDTYSGAAAAYSLRLLDTSYTGDAIVVRRASDNTTQAIGFVNNELDTATLESFCSGTDGFVTTWYDQSGNGYDVAQTTAGKQPKIVSSGSTITDGTKPSVQFDGAQGLNTTANISSASNYYPFYVRSYIGSAAYIWDSQIGRVLIERTNNAAYYEQTNGFEGTALTSSYRLIHMELNSTTGGKVYENGVNTQSGLPYAQYPMSSETALGSRYDVGASWLNGKIQEFVLYNTDQSANRSGIETNINDFYTIY